MLPDEPLLPTLPVEPLPWHYVEAELAVLLFEP
jgi:hypothetical protein